MSTSAPLMGLLGLVICMALPAEGSHGRRWLTSSSNAPSSDLGEASSERILGEGAEPSKNIRAGMVVELRHSSGKGCAWNAVAGYVCSHDKGQVFRVLDAGDGRLALIEGPEPYAGFLRALKLPLTNFDGSFS